MNIKRKRKQRTTSSDWYDYYHDRWWGISNSGARDKIYKRKLEGLCPGCGKKECKCKHKGEVDYEIPVNRVNYRR